MANLVQLYGAKKIAGQEEVLNQKAGTIYSALDRYSEVYQVVPYKTARSRMNIWVRVNGGEVEKEKEFLTGAEKRGLTGLKGHRSVGGIRASNFTSPSHSPFDARRICAPEARRGQALINARPSGRRSIITRV